MEFGAGRFKAQGFGEGVKFEGAGVIAIDRHRAADVIEFDVAAAAFEVEIAFQVRDLDHAAAGAFDLDVLSDMSQVQIAAAGGNLHAAVDVVDGEVAGAAASFNAESFGDGDVEIIGDLDGAGALVLDAADQVADCPDVRYRSAIRGWRDRRYRG